MPAEEVLTPLRGDIVAIIDDDRVFQQITKIKLAKRRLCRRILMFSDGEQAIEFIKEHADETNDLPDIILLDLNMPVMDGWDFLEEFVQIRPRIGKTITIFVATSSVNPEDSRRAQAISAVSDYIVKPVADEALMRLFEPLTEG